MALTISQEMCYLETNPYGDIDQYRLYINFFTTQFFSDNGWDYKDAQVVCRMLGFNPDYAEATKESKYGNVDGSFIINDAQCDGTEESLHDCVYSVNECDGAEAAGVICHGKLIMNFKHQTSLSSLSDKPYLKLKAGTSDKSGHVLYINRYIWLVFSSLIKNITQLYTVLIY